jgi:hypothetical protein
MQPWVEGEWPFALILGRLSGSVEQRLLDDVRGAHPGRESGPAAGPPSSSIVPDAARASCAAPLDLRARHHGAADPLDPYQWAVSRPLTISPLAHVWGVRSGEAERTCGAAPVPSCRADALSGRNALSDSLFGSTTMLNPNGQTAMLKVLTPRKIGC